MTGWYMRKVQAVQ